MSTVGHAWGGWGVGGGGMGPVLHGHSPLWEIEGKIRNGTRSGGSKGACGSERIVAVYSGESSNRVLTITTYSFNTHTGR